jgi:gliding motility-associated-like protein
MYFIAGILSKRINLQTLNRFLFLIAAVAFVNVANGQVLFQETFDEGDNAVNGADDLGSGVTWSTICPDCLPIADPAGADDFFKILSGGLQAQDSNGPATFETGDIDISSCSGNIQVDFDISESGTMEACGTGCVSVDWVAFQYSIDGGAWQDPANSFFCAGGCADLNVIAADDQTGLVNYNSGCLGTGNTIRIRIIVQCWAADEVWTIDNVTVTCDNSFDTGIDGNITYCIGGAASDLFDELGGTPDNGGSWTGPSALANGDQGTFNPASNSAGNYTYTVGSGACAETSEVIVAISAPITPTFNPVSAICSGDVLTALPITSTNGITGAWSPALNNTATTTYTFTPGANQCANTTTLSITVNPIYNNSENVTACEGATYTYPDGFSETISANTAHTSTLTSIDGCDSVIVTNVTMNSIYNTTENMTACEGAIYTYPDGATSTITANESHTSNLTSVDGCDSVIVTNVTMNPIYNITDNVTVCIGSNYTYPDGIVSNNITVAESHVSNLTTTSGCDSIITTNITINTAFTSSNDFNICSGANYTYADGSTATNVTANESHTSTFVSATGCDSLVTENLIVLPVYNITDNINACENSMVTYPDGSTATITMSTSYTSNLTTGAGCDSIIITNVTMDPIQTNTVNSDICSGSSFTYADGTTSTNITANESHVSTLVSAAGCDSIITENLSLLPLIANAITTDICTGSNYTYADGTTSTNITLNENHVSTLTAASGCDSVLTENVNVVTAISNSISIDLCEGENYTYVDGTIATNITVNENHISTLVSASGCDSLLTEFINVNPVYNQVENMNVCENSMVTYPDGTTATITANTSYTSNLLASTGCDSIIVTNVSMDPVYTITENINACENSIYTYPDGTMETITANSSHTSNLTTANGCDSIILTNVVMEIGVSSAVSIDICSGSSFTYADGTVTSNVLINESHQSIFTSANGCDSLITENLNIVSTITTIIDTSICPGVDYLYADGTIYANAQSDQSYTSNLVAASGCDSIVIENLIILPPAGLIVPASVSVCQGESVTITAETNLLPIWSTGDTAVSIMITPTTDTILTVSVYGICDTITETIIVNVFDLPNVDAGPDQTIPLGTSAQLEATGANSFEWSPYVYLDCFDCPNPISSPTGDITYVVTGTDDNGCVNFDTVSIIIDGEVSIFIPNVFSPNGDGQNDYLEIFGGTWTSYEMKVYNRWGGLVFESNDPNLLWDGTKKGEPCPQALFVYKFVGTSILGQQFEKAGNVMLTR